VEVLGLNEAPVAEKPSRWKEISSTLLWRQRTEGSAFVLVQALEGDVGAFVDVSPTHLVVGEEELTVKVVRGYLWGVRKLRHLGKPGAAVWSVGNERTGVVRVGVGRLVQGRVGKRMRRRFPGVWVVMGGG